MSDRESDSPADLPRLAVWPCRSSCAWRPTGTTWSTVTGEELPLFACTGCGSQWVRTEAWTPIDAQGSVPSAVAQERRRQV
ncbi:MAG: hypothetical protein WAK18_12705 [Nocardioidaceae bacterium]